MRFAFNASLTLFVFGAGGCGGQHSAAIEEEVPRAEQLDDGGVDSGAPELDAEQDPMAEPLPTIEEVLDCGTLAAAGGLAGRGRDESDYLQAYEFALAEAPEALCNDGSPAVFYFRPASRPEDRDKWVIQLQGGGGCRNATDCAKRWCGVDSNFGMTQMTSTVAPEVGIEGKGILQEDDARNPWATWNHVFARYCSSDSWAGTRADVDLSSLHPLTSAPVEFRMHFLGARILDAIVAKLRQDEMDALWYTAGGSAEQMPDLDEAAEVVIAGASAGGSGVARNLDRVRELLFERNVACTASTDCPLSVRGLIDSSFGVSMENLDFSGSLLCSESGLCDYEAMMSYEESSVALGLWGSVRDESCVAAHAGAETYRCVDIDHVMRHHLSTPVFFRMGLLDELQVGNLIEGGFTLEGGVPVTGGSFGLAVTAGFEEITASGFAGEEGAFAVVPGVFAPACSKHETLRNDGTTFDTTIRGVSMFEVWEEWINGEEAVWISSRAGDAECEESE